MTNYTRPKGIMGGPCMHCGLPQPLHVGLTCAEAKAKRSERMRETFNRIMPDNGTLKRQILADPDDDPSVP